MAKKRNAKKKAISKNDKATNKVQIASNNINSEAIAAAISTTNLPVLLKVCRLCETKNGPFLNIFDIDKVIAKKIEDVMPFVVTENDDLPHKICFRCSAKVEELYEFIQKCVKTQVNLRRALGNNAPLPTRIKHRALWEEKLNESNISNDDLCDALIKKAMESIKEPIRTVTSKEDTKTVTKKITEKKPQESQKNEMKESRSSSSPVSGLIKQEPEEDDNDIPLKKLKLQIKKSEHIMPELKEETSNNEQSASNVKVSAPKLSKSTSKAEKSAPIIETNTSKEKETVRKVGKHTIKSINSTDAPDEKTDKSDSESVKTNTFSLDTDTKPEEPKPFNILDHVSMIKVNSVGVLYQCKLCNRNFLKKEIILTHGCAKGGGVKKGDYAKESPKPEIPKMPTVKYINTKVNVEPKAPVTISEPINLDDDEEDAKPIKPRATKPKIGPASKVRKNVEPELPPPNPAVPTITVAQPPVVQFPQAPSINGRYKLVPGPNNTFTLVEEGSENSLNVQHLNNPFNSINPGVLEVAKESKNYVKTKASKKVNVDPPVPVPQASGQPYPVGLFQTVSPNSNPPPVESTFTTPAMKKQSYTIVQTGNPNKLLISTKTPSEEAPPKKKSKRSKHETKDEVSKEPFSVTLEDAARPRDSGFFTFVNVDPLLQPSYVLPTDSIIQESQITTTNNVQKKPAQDNADNDKYSCNMCDSKFAREKKLLTHIQSHYNLMDEEDERRRSRQKRNSKNRH